VSLLLLSEGEKPRQADGLASKRALLERPGVLFVLWHGERYTEARVILDGDRERVRDAIG
jgi:hypothetical protein